VCTFSSFVAVFPSIIKVWTNSVVESVRETISIVFRAHSVRSGHSPTSREDSDQSECNILVQVQCPRYLVV
jgi:hypothetical protein